MTCALCNTRRPRRFCPGVRGEICTLCCGKEREETIDCPLDCEFLQEAHRHEKPAALQPTDMPEPDIRVSEEFLREHETLIILFSRALLDSASEIPGVTDEDARQALACLVRTFRTLQSGLIYESRPENPFAAHIYSSVQELVGKLRSAEKRTGGVQRIRDAEFLGVFVFLLRMEVAQRNGRKRSRAFLTFLRSAVGAPSSSQDQPSLLVP
jgi:hypothetical protein